MDFNAAEVLGGLFWKAKGLCFFLLNFHMISDLVQILVQKHEICTDKTSGNNWSKRSTGKARASQDSFP
jgi:hypothetical protein